MAMSAQGAPAARPQPQPPQAAQGQGQSNPPQGGQGGAAAAVSQIMDGLEKLKKILGGAGPAVSPEDKNQFMQLYNGFQAFIEELSKPQGQPAQAQAGPQRPSQPMPANASPGSQPSNF